MKFITLVILSFILVSCASNQKCDGEKCSKENQEKRERIFEPAGSWRR